MSKSKELEFMKQVNVEDVDVNTLVDLRNISIDGSLSKEERMKQFIKEVKNPYCFKVGDIVIKLSFTEDGVSLEELMRNYLSLLNE